MMMIMNLTMNLTMIMTNLQTLLFREPGTLVNLGGATS
jgi:hypothetical protein